MASDKKQADLSDRLRIALDARRLRAVDLCEMAGVPKGMVRVPANTPAHDVPKIITPAALAV